MNLRRIAVVAAIVAAPALACQLLAGIGDDQFRVPPPDGASDAAIPLGPDPCLHASPLARPEGADSPEERTFTFALSKLDFAADAADAAAVGYDLDSVCTCDVRDGSAHGGASSCQTGPTSAQPDLCDGDGGVDNALAALYARLALEAKLLPSAPPMNLPFDEEIRCGRQNLLLTLASYSGEKDDPSVVVIALESRGIRTPHDAGELTDSGCGYHPDSGDREPAYPAKSDGTDRWSFPAGSLTEGANPIPKRSGMAGWVKDFHLVLDGREPRRKLSIPIVMGGTIASLTTPVLTARLVPLDENGQDLEVDEAGKIRSPTGKAASFRMTDGVLAGRFAASDVLTVLGHQRLEGDSYICASKDIYPFIKLRVCDGVDTASVPESDFSSAPCDALSVAFHLEAIPTRYGRAFDALERDGGCADFRGTCGP